MLEAYKKNKHLKILSIILLIGLGLFLILIILTIRIPGSDDTVFQKQILPYHTLIDWVIYRYQSWSGRIFAESFVYIFSQAPLFLWKIMSVISYAAFTLMIFLYYRLFYSHHDAQKDIIMFVFALCMPFLMYSDVLRFGIFWVTGSMNYFWIATLGLVGFYPITYYAVRHHVMRWPFIILGTLALMIASCSQEQVGAILTGLSFIFLVNELFTYKKKGYLLPKYLIIISLIVLISFLVGVLAPGNILRVKAETIHWLPDFYTISLPLHIEYGYRWFLEATINHTGFLLALSLGLLALLFTKKQNKTRPQTIFTCLLAFFSLAMTLSTYTPVGHWLSFYATWKPIYSGLLPYITLISWTIVIISTIIAPLILFGENSKGWLLSFLYLTAFASIGMITLSPTMYASLWRTLFVPSVVLIMISYALMSEVIDKYPKHKYILASIIVILAALGYMYMALRLIHGLMP